MFYFSKNEMSGQQMASALEKRYPKSKSFVRGSRLPSSLQSRGRAMFI